MGVRVRVRGGEIAFCNYTVRPRREGEGEGEGLCREGGREGGSHAMVVLSKGEGGHTWYLPRCTRRRIEPQEFEFSPKSIDANMSKF